MKVRVQLTLSLLVLCVMSAAFAQVPPFEETPPGGHGIRKLDGKSFQGRIRAKGIMGLFSVKGTLSFKNGLMIWSAKGSDDTAPYKVEKLDGVLRFTSHVPLGGGNYVDWSGTFDGESLSNVEAIWTRSEEEDFIHDLFLGDAVTLVFKQKKNN